MHFNWKDCIPLYAVKNLWHSYAFKSRATVSSHLKTVLRSYCVSNRNLMYVFKNLNSRAAPYSGTIFFVLICTRFIPAKKA